VRGASFENAKRFQNSQKNIFAARQNSKERVKYSLAWLYILSGGMKLANIKSQIKRNRQNEKRRVHNRVYRGAARTLVNKALVAVDAGNKDTATAAIKLAISQLDKAAQKGIIHLNNAARRKSRLMKRLAELG
jgi:small subunit ribosomal protein S20